MTAVCSTCGAENPPAARFCGACGARLAMACPHCQAPVTGTTRFCNACGGTLPAADPSGMSTGEADPAHGQVAERRRVSVLFVDLENFTSLAESLDPEEVRSVQARYFEAARSIVASHGGTIEKFIGDAVMAVWGAPIAHEDDAERAVRAAGAIVDAVGRLGGAASGGALAARAAVTTGEAAVTLGASGQGMVAGELVSVAARLQSRAPAGGTLVDGATRKLARSAATYTATRPLTLKGRRAKLTAYRANPIVGPQTGAERGAHSGAFIGRERDLRELIELYRGVVRDGLGRLVSVTGIAGIGKSRLAWEFGEWVEALPEVVAWHVGRAPAYGEGITFAPVAEMVRRRIRAADDAGPTIARRQLAGALDELVRDDAERRWMEPRVAVLLGSDDEHPFDRDELFAAWRRFFERVADRSPVVLVFEDLQWADPALLDFVEHLAAWTRDHPILVLALARPELLDLRPTWAAGLGRLTTLHLERLSDASMRKLLLDRLPALAETTVSAILERAGGVPLYAVEVARILSEDGVGGRPPVGGDRRARSRAAPWRASAGIDVPDSLHGLISARIDALPLAERRLLLSAAVLGRRFRPGALAAVAGGEMASVRELADELVRRELLTIDEELVSPGHGQLVFVQDLVREVAYRTLARSERRALHLAAARFLEGREEDDVAESLATHLLEAHRIAPEHPDAMRIARRAVAALRRAGHDALRLHVPDRALGHFAEALRLVDSTAQRALVLDEAATAARAAARLDVAEGHVRELVALHEASNSGVEAARARAQLASVLLMEQRNESALVELESAVTALGDLGADAAGVEVAAQLARATLLVGDARSGLEWAERAIKAADRLGLDAVLTDVLVTRGTARFRLGDEEAGMADLRRAISEAETAGYLTTELRARNNLAWLVVADDPRLTLETAREGFELATSMGVGEIAGQLAEVACSVALDTGDWRWAMSTIGHIVDGPIPNANRINLLAIAATIGALQGDPEPVLAFEAIHPLPSDTDSQVVAGATHARAWVAFAAGDFDDAQRLAASAASASFGAEQAQQLILEARADLWRGDRDGAASALTRLSGLNVAGRASEASRRTLAAGLAAVDGDETAVAAFRAAAEEWRGLELPIHLALCLLDGTRLLPADSSSPADAIAVLNQLGATGLLHLVDPAGNVVSRTAGPPRPARSRRPRADTARPTGEGRRRQRATDPHAPPG